MLNGVYFFSLIGLKDAFTANLIVFCVLLFGVLLSFYFVDKVGRRPLLLIGATVMSITVFIVGAIGFITLTDAAGNALVAVVCIWVLAYALSVAPIGECCLLHLQSQSLRYLGWVSLVELSTPALRTQTAGLAAVIQSCFNVLFVSAQLVVGLTPH